MLALEHSPRRRFAELRRNLEQSIQAPYPGLTMDSYDHSDPMVSFHPLPFSYFENPAMFSTAPVQMKQEYHQFQEMPPALVHSTSAPSIGSASSSTVGSPYSGPSHTMSSLEAYEQSAASYGLGVFPTIINNEVFSHEVLGVSLDPEMTIHNQDKLSNSFVDPSLIHGFTESIYPEQAMFPPQMQSFSNLSPSGSPALSSQSFHAFAPAPTQFSENAVPNTFYQQPAQLSRRPSLASFVSAASRSSPSSELDEEGREKGRCPHADCGKVFKDLKAHMLTHQAQRPEKCPILTCEYNQKGFARKYDKNRHTLTHYKGTMVCGFCPGSGSPAEKSFNRADVFKRHLTTVHGVEQTPPNSRKRSPSSSNRKLSSYCQDATGKCSTCSQTFSNAQDFYEHLDDCVLRVVQQEEPSEAINAQHLSAMVEDDGVQKTLDRHMIKTEDSPALGLDDEEEDEDDDEDEDEDDTDGEDHSFNSRSGKGAIKSHRHPVQAKAVIGAGISKAKHSKKGMTWSKGGVPLVGKGRKKKKHYPPSWGMSAEKMRMKKRVLCVYDGPRRLWKDDMMRHSEFEVRMMLPDGKNYVTDLDVETMKRAVAFHNATEEEKGPWPSTTEEDVPGFDLNALMA